LYSIRSERTICRPRWHSGTLHLRLRSARRRTRPAASTPGAAGTARPRRRAAAGGNAGAPAWIAGRTAGLPPGHACHRHLRLGLVDEPLAQQHAERADTVGLVADDAAARSPSRGRTRETGQGCRDHRGASAVALTIPVACPLA
jgi:hypothetical protein